MLTPIPVTNFAWRVISAVWYVQGNSSRRIFVLKLIWFFFFFFCSSGFHEDQTIRKWWGSNCQTPPSFPGGHLFWDPPPPPPPLQTVLHPIFYWGDLRKIPGQIFIICGPGILHEMDMCSGGFESICSRSKVKGHWTLAKDDSFQP